MMPAPYSQSDNLSVLDVAAMVESRAMARLIGAAIAIVASALTSSFAAQEPNRGPLTWSAFECATYAEMSGKKDEQVRLFKIGYTAGRAFLDAGDKGTISPEEIKDAPLILQMLMAGPSIEFVLGRIFENAMQSAYDDIVKRNVNGVLLPPTEWITDDEAKATRARTAYSRSNCALIK